MAKKSNRGPRKPCQAPTALAMADIHFRLYRGDAVALADLLKRRDAEWSALRNLKEALEEAGIKAG
jgi:hypothetical protein